MNQPIIGASPEQTTFNRRFGKGKDRAIVFRAGVIFGDGASGSLQLRRIIAREIRADNLPTAPLVGRAEDMVAGHIEHIGVMRREQNRTCPLEAILLVYGSPTRRQFGPDGNIAQLMAAVIVARNVALIVTGKDDVWIIRAHSDIAAFASANRVTIGYGNACQGRTTGNRERRVILLRTVYPI